MVIDANTLELVAKENRQAGDNHDAVPTPDGKYALLTLRAPNPEINTEEKIVDGWVQLREFKGNGNKHVEMGVFHVFATFSGLDTDGRVRDFALDYGEVVRVGEAQARYARRHDVPLHALQTRSK